jgi:hypothetical protein
MAPCDVSMRAGMRPLYKPATPSSFTIVNTASDMIIRHVCYYISNNPYLITYNNYYYVYTCK